MAGVGRKRNGSKKRKKSSGPILLHEQRGKTKFDDIFSFEKNRKNNKERREDASLSSHLEKRNSVYEFLAVCRNKLRKGRKNAAGLTVRPRERRRSLPRVKTVKKEERKEARHEHLLPAQKAPHPYARRRKEIGKKQNACILSWKGMQVKNEKKGGGESV